LAPILGLLAALTLYYSFVVSAGTFSTLKSRSEFYDLLAQGLRAGHLYLPLTPKPALLARADPYHWKRVEEWEDWVWDASLYGGHYYIYWGPVPGLCLWLVKALSTYTETIHDQWLVLCFMLLRLYAGAALIRCYARTQFPRLPAWVVLLAVLVFGVANPTPYFLARPLVYEASVGGGQGFLMLGLYCAYRGLLNRLTQTRWFLVAGVSLACAMGSRGSLLITTPLVIAATVLCAERPAGYRFAGLLRTCAALGGPFLAGLLLYGIYNYQRFDSFFEFGLKYQLTGRPFSNSNHYFVPNFVTYLTSEIRWSCRFPYARLPQDRALTSLIEWPGGYDTGDRWNGEHVAGILTGMVICWFWCVWLARVAINLRRRCAALSGRRTFGVQLALSRREAWLLLCSVAAICAIGPASRMWMANSRFFQDAAGGILLGAIAAAFWLLQSPWVRARRWLRRASFALYFVLATYTCFVGVVLGFTGHTDSFISENKALHKKLETKLSVCRFKRKTMLSGGSEPASLR
jgi:hypothetical protein